jgi:hypothetical protein
MSSLKQIEANRRNALRSTGPTTPEGKLSSSRNALRHGLTSETVIVGLEDIEDYQAFEAAVISDYNAESAVERELVLRLASVLWRLRRATGIETALFDSAVTGALAQENTYPHGSMFPFVSRSKSDRLCLATVPQTDKPGGQEQAADVKEGLANRYFRLTELPTFPLDRLSRYEHLLWRQARQIVVTLEFSRRHKQPPSRAIFPFPFRHRDGDQD